MNGEGNKKNKIKFTAFFRYTFLLFRYVLLQCLCFFVDFSLLLRQSASVRLLPPPSTPLLRDQQTAFALSPASPPPFFSYCYLTEKQKYSGTPSNILFIPSMSAARTHTHTSSVLVVDTWLGPDLSGRSLTLQPQYIVPTFFLASATWHTSLNM